MALDSHIKLDSAIFSPSAISKETNDFNKGLMDIMSKGPKWYEVGAAKYRQMRYNGETPLPKALHLESAVVSSIPSRDKSRTIPTRIFKSQKSSSPPRGVFMHIHGGGWVLQDEASQDLYLQSTCDATGLLAISVGYRLAPEHPFPAGPNDCIDAAEWLIDNAQQEFGAELSFIGGESAGGYLTMTTALHLLQSENKKYAEAASKLKGLLVHFGVYSISWLPQVYNFRKPVVLVLDQDLMEHYAEAAIPGITDEARRTPQNSPLYADLEKLRGKLPPALFTVGTEDCLMDDTVFMSVKWMMAGAEAVVKIIPGAPHGYIIYSREIKGSGAGIGLDTTAGFVNAKLK